MASREKLKVDELIQSISLHIPNPIFLHLTIFPFFLLYVLWFYFWVFVYGIEDYYEAGLITVVGIACVQIFTCLCCFWSVHFRTLVSCRKVSWQFQCLLRHFKIFLVLDKISIKCSSSESSANRKQWIK